VFSLLLAVLKKGRQYTELVHAGRSRSPKSVFVSESAQCSSVSGIREVTSAIVFNVIVMCAAVNLHSE
jgi:hypothetical protein